MGGVASPRPAQIKGHRHVRRPLVGPGLAEHVGKAVDRVPRSPTGCGSAGATTRAMSRWASCSASRPTARCSPVGSLPRAPPGRHPTPRCTHRTPSAPLPTFAPDNQTPHHASGPNVNAPVPFTKRQSLGRLPPEAGSPGARPAIDLRLTAGGPAPPHRRGQNASAGHGISAAIRR